MYLTCLAKKHIFSVSRYGRRIVMTLAELKNKLPELREKLVKLARYL